MTEVHFRLTLQRELFFSDYPHQDGRAGSVAIEKCKAHQKPWAETVNPVPLHKELPRYILSLPCVRKKSTKSKSSPQGLNEYDACRASARAPVHTYTIWFAFWCPPLSSGVAVLCISDCNHFSVLTAVQRTVHSSSTCCVCHVCLRLYIQFGHSYW